MKDLNIREDFHKSCLNKLFLKKTLSLDKKQKFMCLEDTYYSSSKNKFL